MFNKEISLFYRFICLVLYLLVIIFIGHVNTLLILLIFFIVATRKFDNYLYILLYLLSLIAIVLHFTINIDLLLIIVLILCYIVYFFNTTNLNQIINIKKEKNKGRKDETDFNEYNYTHFKEDEKTLKREKNSDGLVYYMTFHLVILFLSVLVGR